MKARILILLVLLTLALTACSDAGQPELIASHPMEGAPIATYPLDPPVGSLPPVVYNAWLELKVSSVERASERATEIAYQQGGYLVSSQSWYQDEDELHKTLVLAVPIERFDTARSEIVGLGSLVSEQVFGELQPSRGNSWPTYSQITLNLQPRAWSLPQVHLPELRPARTFVQAWGVFAAIFGFLLDVVIWLLVVMGPFVLMGLGVVKLYRWRKK